MFSAALLFYVHSSPLSVADAHVPFWDVQSRHQDEQRLQKAGGPPAPPLPSEIRKGQREQDRVIK